MKGVRYSNNVNNLAIAIEQLKSSLQKLKINSLISLLASTICKMTNGHFECELHFFSQNQRLK